MYHLGVGAEHALPDSGQIPQVEDIVKLGWRWKHLDFSQLPEAAGQRHQLWYCVLNLPGEPTAGREVAFTDHTCTTGSQGKHAYSHGIENSVLVLTNLI